MKQKIIYLMNAMYCIIALALVAGSLVLHRWTDALILFALFTFMALADWYRYKTKKLDRKLSCVMNHLAFREKECDQLAGNVNHLLEECVEAKNKKLLMYNCDHCPRQSDTCQKLVYDTHTECVEPVGHFDL